MEWKILARKKVMVFLFNLLLIFEVQISEFIPKKFEVKQVLKDGVAD